MKHIQNIVLLVVAAVLLAGCSSPAYRISKNQEVFDRFPQAVQEKIRQGQVEPGFDKDMVFLAYGQPDREYSRLTANGMQEVWSYTDNYIEPDRQLVTGEFRVRDSQGRIRTVEDRVWVDIDRYHEYEVKRVEFTDGKVSAVEKVTRR